MSRTADQKATDDALTGAIERSIKSYDEDGGTEGFLLMEYLVVTSSTKFCDGESFTAVGLHYRDSDVPLHRALGLLEYAAARVRAIIQEDVDDG
jgi:hypothetical protein